MEANGKFGKMAPGGKGKILVVKLGEGNENTK
jgi:hypothetical protein